MKKNVYGIVLLLLAVLFAFTGCDSGLTNNSGDTGYVRFSDSEDDARAVTSDTDGLGVRDLVWAYVAIKKDGLQTVGASVLDASKAGTDVVKGGQFDDSGYVLRPVVEGFGKGLNAGVGPLSYGEWEFRLYGFKGYDASGKKFTDLAYKGTTYESLVTIRPLASGESAIPVYFRLTGLEAKGTFALGDMYFTIPQGIMLVSSSELKVTITNATLGTFTSANVTVPAGGAISGEQISVPASSFAVNVKSDVDAGLYPLSIKIECIKSSTTETVYTYNYPVELYAGLTTCISGELAGLTSVSGTSFAGNGFGLAVCRIGDKYFTSLNAAGAALEDNQMVVLLQDINGEDVVCNKNHVTFNIDLNGHTMSNITWLSTGSDATYFAQMRFNLASPASVVWDDQVFGVFGHNVKQTIRSIAADTASKTLWVDTDGGYFLINANGWNVYHTGRANSVDFYSCGCDGEKRIGYHCECDLTEWFTLFGFVEADGSKRQSAIYFGDVNIKAFAINTVFWDRVEQGFILEGTPETVIGNIKDVENCYNPTPGPFDASFAKIRFHKGSIEGVEDVTKWGIKGMKMDISNPFPIPAKIFGWYPQELYTGNFLPPTEMIVGNDIDLYAHGMLPIGGRVFYIRGTEGEYKFYNGERTEITGWSTVDDLKDAVYYGVVTPASTDRFFVYAKDNWATSCSFCDKLKARHNLGTVYYQLGDGKKNIDVLYSPPDSTGRRTVLNVGAIETPNYGAGTYKTIWSYTTYKNDWYNQWYDLSTVASGYGWDKGGICPGGCNDWYPCTMGDYTELARWAGAWTGSYSSTQFTPDSTRPTDDEVRADAWDAVRRNLWSSYKPLATDGDMNNAYQFCVSSGSGADAWYKFRSGYNPRNPCAVALIRSFH